MPPFIELINSVFAADGYVFLHSIILTLVIPLGAWIIYQILKRILKRLLIELICWIIKSLVVVQHLVLLEFFKSVLAKSAPEDVHLCEFLSDLRNSVRTIQVVLAAWALHKIKGNALCAPTMAQELSDAACVENVATV